MTYGESVDRLRSETATLLGWHRIQYRLGGPGHINVPVSTTEAERREMGELIQRYRTVTLTWCLEALTATTPDPPAALAAADRSPSPPEVLRDRLHAAVASTGSRERLLDLLAVRHQNPLLAGWQRLAKAAVQAEREFTPELRFTRLLVAEANTIRHDAAELVGALVLLDRRYSRVPGWRRLPERGNLARAAEATAVLAERTGLDPTVEALGWRPTPRRVDTPTHQGTAGALQAQHNLIVELEHFPNALNLRRLLVSQATASHAAAIQPAAVGSQLAARFDSRAAVYRDLVKATRNIGGLAGAGGQAVADSQAVVSQLHRARSIPEAEHDGLHHLARLFSRADARIATILEHGFADKLYFVTVTRPTLERNVSRGIHAAARRWMPVTSIDQSDVLPLVRQRLRPVSAMPRTRAQSAVTVPDQAVHHRRPGCPPPARDCP